MDQKTKDELIAWAEKIALEIKEKCELVAGIEGAGNLDLLAKTGETLLDYVESLEATKAIEWPVGLKQYTRPEYKEFVLGAVRLGYDSQIIDWADEERPAIVGLLLPGQCSNIIDKLTCLCDVENKKEYNWMVYPIRRLNAK